MTNNAHTQVDSSKNYFVWIHLSLLIGALTLLYWQSVRYWIHTWIRDFNYHAGFIIPILSVYMIWKKRELLATTPVKPSKAGIFLITIGILLYVVGQAAYVNSAQQLSFFIIIPGIILYYFGFSILRKLSIPILVLVFMTPYAEPFYSHLQEFVSNTCVGILHLFNAPVYLESHYIQLPNYSFDVAVGCTGIRFITAILPLGLTIAYLDLDLRWKKACMVLFAAILAILTNLFRIVFLLALALKGHTTFVTGTPHIIYGYTLYLPALFILFTFASLLKRFRTDPSTGNEKRKISPSSLGTLWPKAFASYGDLAVVVFIFLIPAVVHARISSQPSISLAENLSSFPTDIGEWEARELAQDEWSPEVIGATDSLHRVYRDPDGCEIRAFFSYLPVQVQGKELVYHANKILPPQMRVVKNNSKTFTISANPHPYTLKTKSIKLSNGTQETKLLYWYRNTDHYLHNEYMAKAFMALDSLLKNRSNGAVFVLMYKSSSYGSNNQEAKIQDFLNHFMPEIAKYLPS